MQRVQRRGQMAKVVRELAAAHLCGFAVLGFGVLQGSGWLFCILLGGLGTVAVPGL